MAHPLLLILEIILTTVIIGAVSVLYRNIGIPDVRFRLRFLIAAFSALLIGLIFHAASLGGYLQGVSLFFEHVFGIIFFTLLGATGLLHFMEKKYQKLIVAGTYAIVAILLTSSVAAQAYFLTRGTVYQLGTREIILAHGFQVAILLLVTAIILRRILVTHSYLTPLTLHRRYPFGIAVVLMMSAVVAHIVGISYAQPPQHLVSFFESALVLPALVIVALYILFSYNAQINLYGRAHVEEGECDCFYCTARMEYKQVRGVLEALNHVLRQVYYGPVDMGIGAREVLFSEFLENTGLAPFFSKNRMELRKIEFLSVPEKYELLYNLSKNILEFILTRKEMINEALLYHLVNFLDTIYVQRGSRPLDFKPHWTMLSQIIKTMGPKAEQHVKRLSNWDRETTFSYFEDAHPTGILTLDEILGGVETHQFLLNISSEVPKLRILHPVIKSCLHGWKNVVYITSDPAAKIMKDLEEEEQYLRENRLKVITLMDRGEEKMGIYAASPLELIESINKCITTFPLSTVFAVIDLNPLAISGTTSQLHAFIKKLSGLRFDERLVVCAFVSKNIPPLSMDILREEADVVLMHKNVSGNIASAILKPEITAGEPLEKDLFQVLRLVYEENYRGKKPAMGELSKALSITPKTARKRVNRLMGMGLVRIEKLGRYRVIIITEKGRQAVLQAK